MLIRTPPTAPLRRPRRAWIGLVLAVMLACPIGFAGEGHSGLRVKPASTWVGLARVMLDVTELSQTGSALTGEYEIRVPMRPREDDRGAIHLDLAEPLSDLLASGGLLTGRVHSEFNGKTHSVECKVEANGKARIVVTTDRRVLSFKTQIHDLSEN